MAVIDDAARAYLKQKAKQVDMLIDQTSEFLKDAVQDNHIAAAQCTLNGLRDLNQMMVKEFGLDVFVSGNTAG